MLPAWLTAADHPWLRSLIDEHERFAGRPRRELEERMREPLARQAPPWKLRIARRILGRLQGTERARSVDARRARGALFATGAASAAGEPRDVVVARAAALLDLEPGELELSLFSDLPGERRMAPLDQAIEPASLALRANLALAQGILFRATRVRLEIEGAARLIVRHAKWKGLIGNVLPRERAQDAVLELSGPFALFRRTLLYGRALAELVPLLSWCDRFRLTAEVVIRGTPLAFELRAGDPIFPAGEPRRFDSKLEERFARDFAKLSAEWDVVREPEPVAAGVTLIFPDFALQHRGDRSRRWLLEIVGFWKREYLEEKLLRLREAAIPSFILCIDEERNVGDDSLPPFGRVVRFRRRVDARAVLDIIEERVEPAVEET